VTVRVYVPASLQLLRGWRAAGELPAALTGYAVTPGLRAWYLDGDDEELEYAATGRAARASLRLLEGAEQRRVVLAVEAEAVVRDDLDEGAVVVERAVSWQAVVAGMVDDPSAQEAVSAAAALVDAADLGDDDAEFVVGEAESHELLWFATQELCDL
jgi:hypothetical protein